MKIVTNQNLEIGISLLGVGCALLLLGVLMFFDRALLLLGNIAFLSGLILMVGLSTTVEFFTKSGKRASSCFFFLGFFLIVMRWGMIGGII